eukprot:5157667-Amphidinium_carterae.1
MPAMPSSSSRRWPSVFPDSDSTERYATDSQVGELRTTILLQEQKVVSHLMQIEDHHGTKPSESFCNKSQ